MITLAYPWILLLLPLPLLLVRALPADQQRRSSIRVPRLWRLAGLTGRQPSAGAVVLQRSTGQWLVLTAAWICVLASIARPQLIGEPITKVIPSRDLLLAVDLSGSMSTEDFTDASGNQVDRLTACKQVLDDFLTRREGDRVGLIFFGSAAFVQAPFSEDLQLCRTLMDEAQVGMAGPQTVIGDAVGLALTVFQRSEQDQRVLILLTDGNDTGSKAPPQEAARIGRDEGVTIHTIAVGDPEAVGEEKIDEEVLQEMASVTGGGFYRADDRDQLAEIYQRLDELDARELETTSYRPKSDLYYWPLAAFLLVGLVYHGASALRQAWPAQVVAGAGAAPATVAAALMCVAASSPSSTSAAGSFHFLRPGWLLAFVPIGLIVIAIFRRPDGQRAFRGLIDPHLLQRLLVQPATPGRIRPVHLLASAWILATLGLAGPTWQREPSPFASDQAAVVFVQEVTPTMLARDVQPSRLARSVHKISDLLAARSGAESALIAYAGSAHLVMPLTADADIIASFAGELSPEIMPLEGDAAADAILLADQTIESAGRPGSIVLITDGIARGENEKLAQRVGAPLHILAVAGDGSKPFPAGSPPAPDLDAEALQQSAEAADATLTVVTPDDQDVQKLSRQISNSFVAAGQDDSGQRWRDMGYWLTPLIGVITGLWFRPGWLVKWR